MLTPTDDQVEAAIDAFVEAIGDAVYPERALKAALTAAFFLAPAGTVEVKPLEWEGIDSVSVWASLPSIWMCYRITLRADRTKSLRLEWLGNRTEELGTFNEWDQAKAAAQRDIDQRLSALLPPQPSAGETRDAAEVAILRDYALGNLTRLGVANHLRRAGFNLRYATDKANSLPAEPSAALPGRDVASHHWIDTSAPAYGTFEQCFFCGAIKTESNANAECQKRPTSKARTTSHDH